MTVRKWFGLSGTRTRRQALFLAGLILGCNGGETAPSRPPDVLVVTIDTARADRFSFTGSSPVATPAVDALARDGAAFLQAVSHVPVTLPAHATIFTGLLPSRHGVRSNGLFRLDPDTTTLAERLRERGYATGAFIAAVVLDRRYGLDQGFDVYDDLMDARDPASHVGFPQRRGEKVAAAALEWLGRIEEQPTFLWVHLFDPHEPYDPPEPERSRYPGSPYDGEIAYVDRVIGKLLDGYKSVGRYRDAVILLTADHGESLGEHGERSHGIFIYDATVHVPLILKAAGIAPGLRIEAQVGHVDLFPTLLALVGAEIPGDLDGDSLLPWFRGSPPAAGAPAYLESLYPRLHHGWAEYRGVRSVEWKFITAAGRELYHLRSDPDETKDLALARPDELERFRTLLRDEFPPDVDNGSTRVEPSPAERRRLEALGYVWSGEPEARGEGSALPDPREKIRDLQEMDRALKLKRAGDLEEAIRVATALVQTNQDAPLFWKKLGDLQLSAGNFPEAVRAFDRALDLWPGDADGWTAKGFALQQLERIDKALAAYEEAIRIEPGQRKARHNRWGLMLIRTRFAEVAAESAEALRRDPSDAEARWAAARVHLASGAPWDAVAELEAGIASPPRDPTLLTELAMTLEELGASARAEQLYREAVRYDLSGMAGRRLRRLLERQAAARAR
jgi:arylsulfatase A-like enzyme/Flp pilus assembly protein TadD